MKNIRRIAGRPLIYWVLDAATQCPEIDAVYVSTDSDDIAEVTRSYGHEKVFCVGRSHDTATDSALTEAAMLEFAATNVFEHMILIQATSPLLTARHLSEGIRQYEISGADSLVSVVRQKRFIWERTSNGQARPVNYNPTVRPRRQDFDGYMVENGAFYITRREDLLQTSTRLAGTVTAYEMPEETFVELDEPSDWSIVETLLLARKSTFESAALRERLANIRLFLCDVDGVMTDAGMYYSELGEELKKFNTKDGKAFELLRAMGIRTGIITGEDTELVSRRARKLRTDFLHQGIQDKLAVLKQLLELTNLDASNVAYIGDDLNDLEVLSAVGFAAAPADAVAAVKAAVHYTCHAKGGEGCVREVVDLLCKIRENGRHQFNNALSPSSQ